jgi:hypothetical protein
MHITIQRRDLKDDRTLGAILVDGAHLAYTLEDAVRPVKIQNETAIPCGVYEVIVNYSQRFSRPLPMLLDVPNFTAIRLHAGNGPRNTEGCILIGKESDGERIWNCSAVVSELTFRIRNATSTGKVFIEVLNPPPP